MRLPALGKLKQKPKNQCQGCCNKFNSASNSYYQSYYLLVPFENLQYYPYK